MMDFDADHFCREIEEEFNVNLRKKIRESWQDYWDWLVINLTLYHLNYKLNRFVMVVFKSLRLVAKIISDHLKVCFESV